MTDGLVLPPGAGQAISGAGMILKVGDGQSPTWSVFEATVGPGFDVGAHLHRQAEELFYILEGELDLLAFEPAVRTEGNWTAWESRSGARMARGGPGSVMHVPAGCPHAFTNPGSVPARMVSRSPRPATRFTCGNSARWSPARARPTRLRSRRCVPVMTFSS